MRVAVSRIQVLGVWHEGTLGVLTADVKQGRRNGGDEIWLHALARSYCAHHFPWAEWRNGNEIRNLDLESPRMHMISRFQCWKQLRLIQHEMVEIHKGNTWALFGRFCVPFKYYVSLSNSEPPYNMVLSSILSSILFSTVTISPIILPTAWPQPKLFFINIFNPDNSQLYFPKENPRTFAFVIFNKEYCKDLLIFRNCQKEN